MGPIQRVGRKGSVTQVSATRRKFFSLMGATPLAAKIAADKAIADGIGLRNSNGMGGSASIGGFGVPESCGDATECNIPYEKRVIGADQYIKTVGVPKWLDEQYRDEAKYVAELDPDIACKKSWSMSVKIQEQRQRNYQRRLERLKRRAWEYKGRTALQKILGFEWPW